MELVKYFKCREILYPSRISLKLQINLFEIRVSSIRAPLPMPLISWMAAQSVGKTSGTWRNLKKIN